MRLSEKRCAFTQNLAKLLNYATNSFDYFIAIDDAKATVGHMPNSLHYDGLAVDLILYDLDWNYLTDSESYRWLGDYWEGLSDNCFWGGGFGDGNHFSMSWDSRR